MMVAIGSFSTDYPIVSAAVRGGLVGGLAADGRVCRDFSEILIKGVARSAGPMQDSCCDPAQPSLQHPLESGIHPDRGMLEEFDDAWRTATGCRRAEARTPANVPGPWRGSSPTNCSTLHFPYFLIHSLNLLTHSNHGTPTEKEPDLHHRL